MQKSLEKVRTHMDIYFSIFLAKFGYKTTNISV